MKSLGDYTCYVKKATGKVWKKTKDISDKVATGALATGGAILLSGLIYFGVNEYARAMDVNVHNYNELEDVVVSSAYPSSQTDSLRIFVFPGDNENAYNKPRIDQIKMSHSSKSFIDIQCVDNKGNPIDPNPPSSLNVKNGEYPVWDGTFPQLKDEANISAGPGTTVRGWFCHEPNAAEAPACFFDCNETTITLENMYGIGTSGVPSQRFIQVSSSSGAQGVTINNITTRGFDYGMSPEDVPTSGSTVITNCKFIYNNYGFQGRAGAKVEGGLWWRNVQDALVLEGKDYTFDGWYYDTDGKQLTTIGEVIDEGRIVDGRAGSGSASSNPVGDPIGSDINILVNPNPHPWVQDPPTKVGDWWLF